MSDLECGGSATAIVQDTGKVLHPYDCQITTTTTVEAPFGRRVRIQNPPGHGHAYGVRQTVLSGGQVIVNHVIRGSEEPEAPWDAVCALCGAHQQESSAAKKPTDDHDHDLPFVNYRDGRLSMGNNGRSALRLSMGSMTIVGSLRSAVSTGSFEVRATSPFRFNRRTAVPPGHYDRDTLIRLEAKEMDTGLALLQLMTEDPWFQRSGPLAAVLWTLVWDYVYRRTLTRPPPRQLYEPEAVRSWILCPVRWRQISVAAEAALTFLDTAHVDAERLSLHVAGRGWLDLPERVSSALVADQLCITVKDEAVCRIHCQVVCRSLQIRLSHCAQLDLGPLVVVQQHLQATVQDLAAVHWSQTVPCAATDTDVRVSGRGLWHVVMDDPTGAAATTELPYRGIKRARRMGGTLASVTHLVL